LVKLLFGDDPKEMQIKSMAVYTRFWERQIMVFNQDNEKRRNTNREYVEPTKQLMQKAQELGIKLIGPWAVEKVDNQMTTALMREKAELRTTLGTLMQEIQSIKHTVAGGGKDMPDVMKDTFAKLQGDQTQLADNQEEKPEEQVAGIKDAVSAEEDEDNSDPPIKGDEYKTVRYKVAKMGKKTFSNWVMENMESFQENRYPAEFIKECRDKWARLYEDDWPFPD